MIKSKQDLKEKLQKRIDDIKANRVYSSEEIFCYNRQYIKEWGRYYEKYVVDVSKIAKQDLENIISYLRYNLSENIIADIK